jgi:hypothetical protein
LLQAAEGMAEGYRCLWEKPFPPGLEKGFWERGFKGLFAIPSLVERKTALCDAVCA